MSQEVMTGESDGNFFSRIVWLVSSPKNLYNDIAAGAPWWQPWIWVSVLNVVTTWLFLPIQIHLASLNPNDLSEEQLEQTIEALERFGFLGLLTAPVQVLVVSAIIAGVSYVVVSLLAETPRFRKYFTLYLYAYIAGSIGVLVSTLVTRMKGVESVRSFHDLASFGPAALIGTGDKILHPVLASFDIFYLWFYILLGAGVAHVFQLTRRSALFVVVPVWLLFVLFALIGSRFGGGG